MATTASPFVAQMDLRAAPSRDHRPSTRRRALTDAHVALVVVSVVVVVGLFLGYMVVNVPVLAPHLPRSTAIRHWATAVVAAAIVAVVDLGVIAASHRRRSATQMGRRRAGAQELPAGPASRPGGRTPVWLVPGSAAASALLFASAFAARSPLWVLGFAVVIPWLPFLTLEMIRVARRDRIYAFYAAVVGFQLLHMGEHTVQVGQLALTNGDLARSHGVFGQLDFEWVHFVSDVGVWLAIAAVIVCLRGRKSPWLWVAFAAASAHAVEHLYLWWIYIQFRGFYTIGGFAGIMGDHGVIGSPLGRPYMHFGYNFVVVVPMVLALWDWRRRSRRLAGAGLEP